jgi:DNA mismatch repair protein MutL
VAKDRHPMLLLALTLPTDYLDVNVHPAKTEVRFQDTQLIRNLIVTTIRQHLTQVSHLTSSTIHQAALDAIQLFEPKASTSQSSFTYHSHHHKPAHRIEKGFTAYMPQKTFETVGSQVLETRNIFTAETQPTNIILNADSSIGYLGHAIAQVYDTYIISQTDTDMIITDQHAAHERLVYEKMKQELSSNNVRRQALLIPEILEVHDVQRNVLLELQSDLKNLGLVIESFGVNGLQIKEIPSLLSGIDARALLQDIADLVTDMEPTLTLQEKVHEICAEMACKGSIKAGRKLSTPEMNQLLRDMEKTPFSGQCNHGRPTYVKLRKTDIEKLFGRT